MKQILSILIVLTLFLSGCGLSNNQNQTDNKEDSSTQQSDNQKENKADTSKSNTKQTTVEIAVEDYGSILIELDPEYAPETVQNFLSLVGSGFYDGLTFHRIISGFMIQGGDPEGNGTGSSGTTIKGEFSANGIDNPNKHTRGAVSMARSNDPDSASSQFFIVHEESSHLDGSYAVFGYVTDGMDIVDKLCDDTPVQDKNGTVSPDDQPVITSVKVIE